MPRVFSALSLLLTLVACAPAQMARGQGSRAADSPAAVFMPGGQQLAQVCTGHGRVAPGGELVWDSGQTRLSRPVPYLLSCYDFTLKNDGTTLSVQDDTLALALTRFDPSANFLHYFAGLTVQFPRPGLVSADPAANVPDGERSALEGVSVTVSQPGQPDAALIRDGAVTAQRFDPAQPLTLHFSGASFLWPEVTVWFTKGLVRIPLHAP